MSSINENIHSKKKIKHFFFNLVEACTNLLSKELKRNLFQLFSTWIGSLAKPLSERSHANQTSPVNDEDNLQFSALQVFKVSLLR